LKYSNRTLEKDSKNNFLKIFKNHENN